MQTAKIIAAFSVLASIGITPSSTVAERSTAFRAYSKACTDRETDAYKAVTQAMQTIKRVEPVAKPSEQAKQAEQPEANDTGAQADSDSAKPEPEAAQAEASTDLSARRAARRVAAQTVRAYYTGASLPFKAAADTFKPLNFDNACKPTQRQAALLASMLLAGDNVQADGSFIRGGFTLPDDAGVMRAVQPESGCLGNMLNRVVTYVSGPTSGAGQRDCVMRVNLDLAKREISEQLGGALASAALARIAELQAPSA